MNLYSLRWLMVPFALVACGRSEDEDVGPYPVDPGVPRAGAADGGSTQTGPTDDASDPGSNPSDTDPGSSTTDPGTVSDAGSSNAEGARNDGGTNARDSSTTPSPDTSPDAGSGTDPGTRDAATPIAPLTEADKSAARTACITGINAFRTAEGVAKVTRNTEQESCVDTQAEKAIAADNFVVSFKSCTERSQVGCYAYVGDTAQKSVKTCLDGMGKDKNDSYKMVIRKEWKKGACGLSQATDGRVWIIIDMYD